MVRFYSEGRIRAPFYIEPGMTLTEGPEIEITMFLRILRARRRLQLAVETAESLALICSSLALNT